MIDAAFLVTSFATLFVVVDPIGLVPMFIALTIWQNGAASTRNCGAGGLSGWWSYDIIWASG